MNSRTWTSSGVAVLYPWCRWWVTHSTRPTCVAFAWSIMGTKMTSSTKPDVLTYPNAKGPKHEIWWSLYIWFLKYARGQTGRYIYIYRHAHRNTPLPIPYRRWDSAWSNLDLILPLFTSCGVELFHLLQHSQLSATLLTITSTASTSSSSSRRPCDGGGFDVDALSKSQRSLAVDQPLCQLTLYHLHSQRAVDNTQ